ISSFVFAGLLQKFLAVELEWFPVALLVSFKYSSLPMLELMIFPLTTTARFTRTKMIDVLCSDFILTERAKDISEYRIIFKHGLSNALIPLVTVMGPMAVSLMTGTLVIEQIFAVHGIGEQFVTSVMVNDTPTIMGTTLLFAFLFVVIILIIEFLYLI